MPKLKPNKGVKERCKITGTGKVRFNKAGRRHLNSHIPGKRQRHLRGSVVAASADIPYLFKKLHQPLRGREHVRPVKKDAAGATQPEASSDA
ncbi:MAG: 50S ribosomal protein L35 [Planctomycetota bacterium]